MNVQYINDEIPYIIIDDCYTEEERSEMMFELDYLTEPRRMIPAGEDSRNSAGIELKNVPCQYLDPFFNKREHSSILTITEKIFGNSGEIINNHPHWIYNAKMINCHWTHILYYEDEQEYQPHVDTTRFTALTYFYREPKRFSGGDLRFDDYDIEIECINNRVIIFPSMVPHASTPVKMQEHPPGKYGKFCISQFMLFKSYS